MNAFYVWHWGDDYLIKLLLSKTGTVNFLINDYMHFDGRSLSVGYFISRFCLSTNYACLATVTASILFFAMAVLLVKLMHIKMKMPLFQGFILSVFFTAVLWLGSFYSLSETLYWQTGMLYVVELFMMLLAYTYLNGNKVHQAPVFGLSFLSGIASPGAVLAFLLVLLIEYWNTGDSVLRKNRVWSIFGVLSGLILVLASPGNAARLKIEGGLDEKAFGNVHEMYFRLHQFMDQFFAMNTPAVWMCLVLGLTIVMAKRAVLLNGTMSFKQALFEYRWLIAAFVSLMFYFPRMKYYITSPRLNIHFVCFITVFFALQLSEFRLNFNEVFTRFFNVIQIPVLVMFSIVGFYQLWGAMHCSKKMAIRMDLYKANKGKHLVLKANDLIGPPATRSFIDITEDSSYLLNIGVAQYYGLQSIRKEKYR